MSLQENIERTSVRALMALPAGVAGRLAGLLEKVDRSTLDPKLRLLLALSDGRKGFHELPLPRGRALYGQMIRMLDVPEEAVAEVRDIRVPVEGGDILVRLYRPGKRVGPAPADGAPAILFAHGGGFTIGSAVEYDRLCRHIANQTGAVVLNVDYRLAPEHPAPTAAEDVLAAWRWLTEQAGDLGIDRDRLAVMGDSAGGNLSVVVAQQAGLHALPVPKLVVAVYPKTDGANEMPSATVLGGGQGGLDRDMIDWFHNHYMQDERLVEDFRVSPLRNPDLAGHPETLLITATDPLRDEGLAYGERLREAGVPVVNLDYPKLVHGFITMGGALPAARRAVDEILAHARERL
ncbi:MAG: alpha/beta hydrolase [Alcanivorax sp.]|nr:alpha/beta hydrolase [Alcanivorax sp.]